MNLSHFFLVAAAAIVPIAASAAPITSNPSFSVGGLSFSSFGCSLTKGGVLAQPSSCSQINVSGETSPALGLQITSGFVAAGNSFDDAVISYKLSSTNGISKIGLDFNGFFLGLGISSVSESVFNSDGKLVGFGEVACGTGVGCNRSTSISLNGAYTNLFVEKDINVTAATNGAALASVIDQTFTTTTPEPASMALLGTGLVGAYFLKRKKASAQ